MAWTSVVNTETIGERGTVHEIVTGTMSAAADPSPILDAHNFVFVTIVVRQTGGTAITAWQAQVSDDGVNFVNFGASVAAASAAFQITGPFAAFQLVPTAGASGATVAIDLIAANPRG